MKILATCVLCAAALAGCGGSSSDSPPTASVYPEASESIGGFIDYLQRLVASAADTLEPVDTSAVTPPRDETSDPRVVD